MPEATLAQELANPPKPWAKEGDQAEGLRRLVQARGPGWTPMLLAGLRNAGLGPRLLPVLQDFAAARGRLLVVDAARVQVGAAAGLALRYDLEHVLAGDCPLGEACVAASERMWILPAGRALDGGWGAAGRGREVAAALMGIAAGFDEVVLLLPAARASWLRQVPQALGTGSAVVPMAGGAEASTTVLSAIRGGVAEAEIADFHLLILGLGEAAAGRLLSGVAAIAGRHFGARVTGARTLAGAAGGDARTARARAPGTETESGSR